MSENLSPIICAANLQKKNNICKHMSFFRVFFAISVNFSTLLMRLGVLPASCKVLEKTLNIAVLRSN